MGDDKNNFYVMDDAYIEEKYVKAEEERQKQEEMNKKQRETDEANALADAERQRKAADAERRRRQDEAERISALENAKTHREKLDKLRKEKEASYQKRLEVIEQELTAIRERKGGFIDEKLKMAQSCADGEADLKNELQAILEEKRKILNREQDARVELESYQSKSSAKQLALDNEEKEAENKLKSLTNERRNVQNEMLEFLRNPTIEQPAETPAPAPTPTPSYQPQPTYNQPPVSQQPYQPPQNQPMYQQPPPQYQPPPQHYQPPTQQYQPPASQQYNSNPFGPGPSQSQPAPEKNKSQSSLDEQLAMLDDLLKQGIMNKDEYKANRQEALKAAGVTESQLAGANSGTGNSAVDQQIAQLDDYLRTGVLQKGDYDDAKKRVLADAGITGTGTTGSGAPPPAVTGRTTQVAVVVPATSRPGDKITITYQGRKFDVTVPNGVYAGQQFHALIPV